MNRNIGHQLVVHVALLTAFTMSLAHHASAQAGNNFREHALVRAGDSGFGRAADATVAAFQPGFLRAYHIGSVFVFAEVKVYVTPSPGALGFFGGIGFAP